MRGALASRWKRRKCLHQWYTQEVWVCGVGVDGRKFSWPEMVQVCGVCGKESADRG